MPMKKYLLITPIICLFIAVSNLYADDPWLEAFGRLTKVERFAFGKVGVAAVTSQGEQDLRTLIEGECPVVALKILYATGTLQAKCYALVALQKLSKKDFDVFSEEMENLDGEVTTVTGCEIIREPIHRLLISIKSGAYTKYID